MYPLMYACQHGHFKLVELLLSKHADMNQQDIRGWTVSVKTIFYAQRFVCEIMLKFNIFIQVHIFIHLFQCITDA